MLRLKSELLAMKNLSGWNISKYGMIHKNIINNNVTTLYFNFMFTHSSNNNLIFYRFRICFLESILIGFDL